MNCSAALLQNMRLMPSASQERQKERLQYTLTLQTDHFSIPLQQKPGRQSLVPTRIRPDNADNACGANQLRLAP
ncbi:unnamed protein product [Heligmosomoides polygyrus]|uniref:Uncharacterized protein n=1 Tax=Heligmosomoides polygyrus TaxID=6339 RepID=A0A183GFT5_HELPZ|nr:unnamed protein product [Heligmosomoides polygyrus]